MHAVHIVVAWSWLSVYLFGQVLLVCPGNLHILQVGGALFFFSGPSSPAGSSVEAGLVLGLPLPAAPLFVCGPVVISIWSTH